MMKKTRFVWLYSTFLIIALCIPSSLDAQVRTYELWEPKPAPNRGGVFNTKYNRYPYDKDWEYWSYPLGNGTLGVNLFGRTDTERVQLSEKTVGNANAYGHGGITNLAEIYLDFGHEGFSDYRRSLNLNDAIAHVSYSLNGVRYQREYFTSYADDVLVIRMTADKQGSLSFIVRPEIPYLKSVKERDRKTGKITIDGTILILAGTIDFFNLNYETQVRVIHEGGNIQAENNTIAIKNADSATLIIGADTNYKLSPQLFLSKPKDKLDSSHFPHDTLTKKMEEATSQGVLSLKARHLEDYRNLFGRVNLNLNAQVSPLPTHQLLKQYKEGEKDNYLEELMFQYGRYLLIASSRETSLPAHLQGAWTQYESSPWSGGYWHNINVQMNYWGAMSTNLAETFEGYLNYFNAYLPQARVFAKKYLKTHRPEMISEIPEANGWIIGTGCNAYHIGGPGGHSGPGTGGFTTKLLMEYYHFTQDETYLRETAYPALLGMSRFFSKALYPTDDGLLMIKPSASPEQHHNKKVYKTVGCTFDQSFVWENHSDVLVVSKILGIKDPFLETISEQLPKLDPILIGSSGQIKEYREEDAYSEIGDPKHRHISHLCPLYPGTLINSKEPKWMAAASKTLDLRGNKTTGWAMAHRMNCRARLKEGEKAHEIYQMFIADKTVPNLWTLHPPFQIDGNFGVMAGTAEMLLQSHEGWLEPIPALPSAWHTGMFSGLVARGNFVVSASWEKNRLLSLMIKSRSGRPCQIKYPALKSAKILNQAGETVSSSMTTDGAISFKTKKGETYTIKL